jgi:hypothetical protein
LVDLALESFSSRIELSRRLNLITEFVAAGFVLMAGLEVEANEAAAHLTPTHRCR